MRRFVADASHELRTPLTSIRGFAELYRQGAVPDPESLDRVMRRVEDEAARMGLLVEDLLLLARLDQQRPLDRSSRSTCSSSPATPSTTPGCSHPTGPSGSSCSARRAPVVLGDEARLRQVVMQPGDQRADPHPGGYAGRSHRRGHAGRGRRAGPGAARRRRPRTGPVRGGPRPGRSSGSTGPTRPGPGRQAAPGSACPSSPPWSRPTAAGSASSPRPARAAGSWSSSPSTPGRPVHRLITGSPSMMPRRNLSTGPSDVPR